MESHLYQQLAGEFSEQIRSGHYRPGDRLPGVRGLSKKRGVSVATTLAAYRQLEDEGFIEVRPRSGFYVRARQQPVPIVKPANDAGMVPKHVTGQNMALALIQAANNPAMVPLGAAVPDPSYLPAKAMENASIAAVRRYGARTQAYEMPPGAPELRRQIARRMGESGCPVGLEEIVITSGCQEALTIALKAVTQPGDLVAVESPTFYGLLQVLDSLGLEALEIPSDPQTGLSLDAMQMALERWPVKACVVVPNCSNPLGYIMPDQNKMALIRMLAQHRVPLIEDDVYGELAFSNQRPSVCRGLVPEADIIYCSSFSKTLSPGMRCGWIAAGRHREKIEYLKFVSSIATPALSQLAIAHFLESGRYDRYLRQVRNQYQRGVARMTDALGRLLPDTIRVSQPQGGFVLWVELAKEVDCFELAKALLPQGVSIAPGTIFSASQKFRNFMRLSCACRWDDQTEKALSLIGREIAVQQAR